MSTLRNTFFVNPTYMTTDIFTCELKINYLYVISNQRLIQLKVTIIPRHVYKYWDFETQSMRDLCLLFLTAYLCRVFFDSSVILNVYSL